MAGLLAAIVVVSAASIWWLNRPPVLPFEQRDWVLIARFENRTGQETFDGTVEYALEREISNSQFINVVPRERVVDTLRLMKKAPATTIDPAVGLEVCQRDGAIRALITGRAEKLDGTYLLSASLVDPQSGVTVASFSEEAKGEREALGAIQRLSHRVRRTLGEKLSWRSASQEKLPRVSTFSLRALQLYAHGDALIRSHRSEQAADLLQEALREDPEFASAHVLLAHALSNAGRTSEAEMHYQKALELSRESTETERLFILSSYHQRLSGDRERSLQALEALLRVHPDHYWAASNLAAGYAAIGQPARATPHIVRRADLRPHNFDHQLRAAHALVLAGNGAAAEPYAQRARRLIEADAGDPVQPWRAAWVRFFPAHARWLEGDPAGALTEAERIAVAFQPRTPLDETATKWELGSLYLNTGRVAAAREAFRDMRSAEERALIALALGEELSLASFRGIQPSHRAAILMARAGLIADAEKTLRTPDIAHQVRSPFLPSAWESLARGELALAQGSPAEAIPLLEEAITTLRAWPTPYFFLGVDALARAWERQGNVDRSLSVLEEASPYGKAGVFWGPAPLFWIKNEMRRAEMYRSQGRLEESGRVMAGLASLLKQADADFFPRAARP